MRVAKSSQPLGGVQSGRTQRKGTLGWSQGFISTHFAEAELL